LSRSSVPAFRDLEIQEETMRLYDIVLVISPDKSGDDTNAVVEGFRKLLVDDGAQILKDEPWGKRRLAYPIAKRREGIYHLFQVEAKAETIAELERKLKLSDDVLRHLAVRADEEIRRSQKLTKKRQEKIAKKPKKVVAPEAQPEAADASGVQS